MFEFLVNRVSATSPLWLTVWIGSGVLAVALIILMGTRWGQSKPMRKCAVLSLLAHVLLACAATTVRIVVHAGDTPDGSRVSVTLLSDNLTNLPNLAEHEVAETEPWDPVRATGVIPPDIPPLPPSPPPDMVVQPRRPGATATSDEQDTAVAAPGELKESTDLLAAGDPAPATESAVETVLPEPPGVPPIEASQPDEPVMTGDSPAAGDADQPGELDGEQLAAVTADAANTPQSVESVTDDYVDDSEPATDDLPQVAADLAARLEPDSHSPQPSVDEPGQDPDQQSERNDVLAGDTPQDVAVNGSDPSGVRSDPSTLAATDVVADAGPRDIPLPNQAAEALPAVPRPARPATTQPVDEVYAHRRADRRRQAVITGGGSPGSEQAVAEALRWLAQVQSPDGRWDPDRLEGGREQLVLGQHRYGAGARADTGVTGLALLAFLGGGHTQRGGNYRETVRRGCDYLIGTQGSDGNLSGPATFFAKTYCHSMATFALAEALALTGDSRLRPAVSRAVGFSLATQNVRSGGWRYQAGDVGDTSQLGWQVMALHTADLAGVEVPDQSWQRISRFLGSVIRGGRASYRPREAPSRTMTAEAFYCQHLLTRRGRHVSADHRTLDQARSYLVEVPPGRGQLDLYNWYYATLLLHATRQQTRQAGQDWETWNAALQQTLLASQISHGSQRGSWPPETRWAGYGGRVYSTATATLCLEVYYRYSAPRPAATATRFPQDSRSPAR